MPVNPSPAALVYRFSIDDSPYITNLLLEEGAAGKTDVAAMVVMDGIVDAEVRNNLLRYSNRFTTPSQRRSRPLALWLQPIPVSFPRERMRCRCVLEGVHRTYSARRRTRMAKLIVTAATGTTDRSRSAPAVYLSRSCLPLPLPLWAIVFFPFSSLRLSPLLSRSYTQLDRSKACSSMACTPLVAAPRRLVVLDRSASPLWAHRWVEG